MSGLDDVGLVASGKVLLVGVPGPVHVGAHLNNAAAALGLPVVFRHSTDAFAGPAWLVKLNWWLRGHRPARLRAFSRAVVQACRESRPSWVLTTGLAPIDAWALTELERLGVQRFNYLTDDPWNRAHRAPWFMRALPLYDHVFSPRRANLDDLRRLSCPGVSYLPFAYAPEMHFPEPPITPEERARFAADVVFAGGADRDRVPYIAALTRAGVRVALYGGYWERYPETRAHARGPADARTLRKAIGGAKVALCLVRRSNRDGHVMRTFEVAATGACMLAEDTEEHREILGPDGDAVVYFRTIDEMVIKVHGLLEADDRRRRLAGAARRLIVDGQNTYADRLQTMLTVTRLAGGWTSRNDLCAFRLSKR